MAKETKTVWYRNTETDVVWEVELGSAIEKRLRTEFTDDEDNPTRRYEQVDAPAVKEPTREELDATARELGVTEPEKLPNKAAVQAAIDAARPRS